MNKQLLRNTGYMLWYMLLAFFTWLMLLITIQYIDPAADVAFLLVKQDVAGNLYYRIAFFTHVYSSIIVLTAGLVQLPATVRKHFPRIHRLSGRLYVAGILLLAGPGGLIMGIYGNGGMAARLGFCLLAIFWMAFTYKGFTAARSGNIAAHRKWMYRSYALTLSAISLRLWKWLLVFCFAPKPMDVYQVVAWLGWTGNLLVVECLLLWKEKRDKMQFHTLP